MAVVHSAGNHKACDTMMEEVIVVTATVSTDQIRFKVKGIAGFSKPADHPGRRLYPVSQTKGFCLKINRGTCKECGFFAGFFDFIELTQCTFIMEAANLSGYDAGFRNNIGRRASCMVPTFTVVSPIRPQEIASMACAAALMAWIPFSGEKAAWAALPWKTASKERIAGA